MGYTELVSLDVPEDSPAKENLKDVFRAIHKAKDLVKQVLAFSRHSKKEKKPLRISLIVKEPLKLLRVSLPATIDIRQRVEGNTAIIEADPT
ncbi:MAG: hypothetical protein QGG48_00905 [Desulfatiglandales bacterium]|jgi:hypothetical protein|nr:hypothetical protein [Desulfatiglandales bacterium]